MAAQIIPFPQRARQVPHDPVAWMSKPHEFWTLEDSAEEARYRVATLREEVADFKLFCPAEKQLKYAAKRGALMFWEDELIAREAALKTGLIYNGITYAETVGVA
ncbi:hypothetical protein [Sphingobium sp. YR768]|uniref:hypothetical protein n=1 Tax=Sphingobium sp. YR768 TaxID=1884365 RepID=UPI00115F945F|nr:hypothetical protein [Sphingobium sp. YR768]